MRPDEVKAYAGGLFDGEGSVEIGWNRNKRSMRMRCIVRMTTKAPVEFMQSRFSGSLNPGKRGKNRQQWSWVVSSQEAAVFLREVMRYLKVKKEEAMIALEFQEFVGGRRPGQRLTDMDVEKMKTLKARLTACPNRITRSHVPVNVSNACLTRSHVRVYK